MSDQNPEKKNPPDVCGSINNWWMKNTLIDCLAFEGFIDALCNFDVVLESTRVKSSGPTF